MYKQKWFLTIYIIAVNVFYSISTNMKKKFYSNFWDFNFSILEYKAKKHYFYKIKITYYKLS